MDFVQKKMHVENWRRVKVRSMESLEWNIQIQDYGILISMLEESWKGKGEFMEKINTLQMQCSLVDQYPREQLHNKASSLWRYLG